MDFKDDELIRRIVNQDQRAMKVLYLRHQAPLISFTTTRLKDPVEAADIVQEVMIDVWRQADRFAGRSSVRTWLFTMARNKAIDRLRRTSRLQDDDDHPEQIDDGPTPEEALIAARDRERVRKCISGLSPAHQVVIHLAFFEHMSYPEISAIENIPVGTVKTRVHHAKQLLARCLTPTP